MSEENAERLPWFVASETEDGQFLTVTGPSVPNFKTQVEADAWIKENISEGVTLVSLRMGKRFKGVFRAVEI